MNTAHYAWVPLSHSVLINGAIHSMEVGHDDWNAFPYVNILASLIMWSTFYFILQYYNWRKSCEWNCRIVTFVHAVISTTLSFYSAFVVGPNPIKEPGLPVKPLEFHILIISLGYFIYDLFWCLYHQSEGGLILIHHLASLACLVLPLASGASGGEVVVSLVAMESTNPILQTRWFLRESGYKNSVIVVIVDFIFITMFFIMRVICGTYMLYSVVRHPRPSFVTKLGGTSFMIISYMFMYSILRYAFRKYILRQRKPIEAS